MEAVRRLTGSGLKVPALGLGCATLAFDTSTEALALARDMLSDALASGITFFDTAPFYGRGLSERMVGDALRERDVVLATKVGRLLVPDNQASTYMPFRVDYDYTYDGIMRSVEHSLQRLGRSHVDILYAHDLGEYTHGTNAKAKLNEFFAGGGYRALDALRSDGTVQAIGLGVNEIAVCRQVMERGDFDVFLLAGRHTLLERTASLDFFTHCASEGTDIVIGGPFNSGLLVGGTTYNYRTIPEDIARRHKVLLRFCTDHNVNIGAAALQFPLRQSVVKSVIPGPKTPTELRQIQDWMTQTIPASFWSDLSQLDETGD